MNELTFDELRQIDGGSYEEGRELGHKIGKAFYGACANVWSVCTLLLIVE